MITFGDYFSTPKDSSHERETKAEKEAMNLKSPKEFKFREPSPDKGFYSPPPPDYNRTKRSYRASYPPSKREMQASAAASNACVDNDGMEPPLSPCTSSHTPSDSRSRPRRSSLHQPGQRRRRNSTPAKRVRFNMTDTIYEPFDAQDSQTIDQIMALLHLPPRSLLSPSIPSASSYSIGVIRADAAHECPEPISPTRSVMSNVNSSRGEFVASYPVERRPRSSSAPDMDQRSERLGSDARRHLDRHHQSRSEVQLPLRSPSGAEVQQPLRSPTRPEAQSCFRSPSCSEMQSPLCSPSRVDVQHEYRSEVQSPLQKRSKQERHSGSHYETHSQRQAQGRSETLSRPRGYSLPPAAESTRSSLESDETIINTETTWAPASVMLGKSTMHIPPFVDEDVPIARVPDESNALRRKDAQRLPVVPRRHKLLHNITHMFE